MVLLWTQAQITRETLNLFLAVQRKLISILLTYVFWLCLIVCEKPDESEMSVTSQDIVVL